jgi:hypothetical protein
MGRDFFFLPVVNPCDRKSENGEENYPGDASYSQIQIYFNGGERVRRPANLSISEL